MKIQLAVFDFLSYEEMTQISQICIIKNSSKLSNCWNKIKRLCNYANARKLTHSKFTTTTNTTGTVATKSFPSKNTISKSTATTSRT